MANVTISYFDFPGGRGEDCRIALHIAGVPFEDDRIKGPDWASRKATTPFGALPVLTVDGRALWGSNAILRYIGLEHGLLPSDAWEVARHDALMDAVEDLRARFTTTSSKDADEKKANREAFAQGYLRDWCRCVEAQIQGPFIGGEALSVADLKVFIGLNFYLNGAADHVGPEAFEGFEKLMAHHRAVAADPGVQSWYARG